MNTMNMSEVPIEMVRMVKHDKSFSFLGRQGDKETGVSVYCRSKNRDMIVRQITKNPASNRYDANFMPCQPVDDEYGYVGYGAIDIDDGDIYWIVRRSVFMGIKAVLQRGLFGELNDDEVELLYEGKYLDRLDIYPKKFSVNVVDGLCLIPRNIAEHFVDVV